MVARCEFYGRLEERRDRQSLWEKALLNMTAKDLIISLVAAFICYVCKQMFSLSNAYWSFFSKKITEKHYKEYLNVVENRSHLTTLLLEGIGRCIPMIFLNAFGVLVIFSPAFSSYTYNARYYCATGMTLYVFLLVLISLSKPIDLCWALRNQEKYKNEVRKKLGSLPGESDVSFAQPIVN